MINLKEILEQHKLWLQHKEGGKRADLRRADLSRADLYGVNLSGAYLSGANLRRANLYGAYLSGADLSGADLGWADLYGADLRWADLSRADLRRADLSRADLRWAYLSGAYLSRADLRWADLYGADLTNTKFDVDISEGIVLLTPGPYMFLKGKDKIKIGCEIRTLAQWKRVSKKKAHELELDSGYFKLYKAMLDLPLTKWW
jgi:hypothetical protein